MTARWKLWLVAFAFLALLAAQVFGSDALRWYTERGGPTGAAGIINLPLAAKGNYVVQTNMAREGFNMLDLERGVVLNLPIDMTGTVAVVTTVGGLPVSTASVQGSMTLDGKNLVSLRDNGVYSFELTMVDAESRSLRCVFRFKVGEAAYKILVW
jgi:hypothetical protein